ncbi:MAG TPA: hemolysin III family protein [Polyangiaceae bacterium]|nr:hemolysin III family protein [Polyangiaceae bacterium]
MAVETLPLKLKPRYRGVSHQVGFFVAIVAGLALFAWAKPGVARGAAAVFGGSVALLLGTSALYHRRNWEGVGRERMRRLDHAAIFVLIAGGWTPLLTVLPRPGGGRLALALIVGGAALGVVKSLLWPNAPKWIIAVLCVALGWAGIGEAARASSVLGAPALGLLVASGVAYSVGALVYARKRPDPLPEVFGYHEVFHALVLVATACLYGFVVIVLQHG